MARHIQQIFLLLMLVQLTHVAGSEPEEGSNSTCVAPEVIHQGLATHSDPTIPKQMWYRDMTGTQRRNFNPLDFQPSLLGEFAPEQNDSMDQATPESYQRLVLKLMDFADMLQTVLLANSNKSSRPDMLQQLLASTEEQLYTVMDAEKTVHIDATAENSPAHLRSQLASVIAEKEELLRKLAEARSSSAGTMNPGLAPPDQETERLRRQAVSDQTALREQRETIDALTEALAAKERLLSTQNSTLEATQREAAERLAAAALGAHASLEEAEQEAIALRATLLQTEQLLDTNRLALQEQAARLRTATALGTPRAASSTSSKVIIRTVYLPSDQQAGPAGTPASSAVDPAAAIAASEAAALVCIKHNRVAIACFTGTALAATAMVMFGGVMLFKINLAMRAGVFP